VITRERLAGAGLILLGLGGVVFAAVIYFDAFSAAQEWRESPEADRVALQLAEPTPIWIAPATPEPFARPVEPLPAPAAVAEPLPTPSPSSSPSSSPDHRLAPPDALALASTEFRFLDPPEPGARARVAITVGNSSDVASDRILLGVPSDWFRGYSVIGSVPAVAFDRIDEEGLRNFSFPPVPAGESATYELHVAPRGEEIRPPSLTIRLADGESIGDAKPPTQAPPPRPGPVMSLEIPSLKLKSGVVPIDWEAPPFVVGQLKNTSNITLGNTVLIGHVSGRGGNIFARLDDVKPGDKVTAVSRGVPYEFVVSQIVKSTNIDASWLEPTDESRLTLMTCAGVFNPITRDYSERLWVIAEAPDRAVETIARVSATATAEATAAVAATATAIALIPTPTPYAGEPSLAGGLGNTRDDIGSAFGAPLGETARNLVVFRQASAGREFQVLFTPDPARSALLGVIPLPGQRLTFDQAVRESRRYFPTDTRPRADAPEGNPEFVVERFESASLEAALGIGEFSVVYLKDRQGLITRYVLGLGEDFAGLIEQTR
jgi:LPXTG-site transpeptidase (sortase) family protein